MNGEVTISKLKGQGYKMTEIRKGIIALFSRTKAPLSANEVRKKLSSSGLGVNKTTIYRELQFLVKEKCLTSVQLKPSEVAYESTELEHHHHLICETCGKIDEVTNCLAEELEKRILKNKGFVISRHALEFYGRCLECRKQI